MWIRGYIIAPNANMQIASRTIYRGCMGAKNILFQPDVTVNSNGLTLPVGTTTPSGPTCYDAVPNGDESATDCGGPDCLPCEDGRTCFVDADCQSGDCGGGICQPSSVPSCTEWSATDLGPDSNNVTVPNNGCVMVRDQYPSWWGTRNMNLQAADGGTYPVPFTWWNSCAASGGSGTFNMDWEHQIFGPTSDACATVIDLQGTGGGNITLRYYGA